MKDMIEKGLRKVFGAKASDPEPESMTKAQKREAQAAMMPSGARQKDDVVDDNADAPTEARGSNIEESDETDTPVIDHADAETDAKGSNVEDGSGETDQPVDDSHEAHEEAKQSNPHEPPRSELARDNEQARRDAELASEKRGS